MSRFTTCTGFLHVTSAQVVTCACAGADSHTQAPTSAKTYRSCEPAAISAGAESCCVPLCLFSRAPVRPLPNQPNEKDALYYGRYPPAHPRCATHPGMLLLPTPFPTAVPNRRRREQRRETARNGRENPTPLWRYASWTQAALRHTRFLHIQFGCAPPAWHRSRQVTHSTSRDASHLVKTQVTC